MRDTWALSKVRMRLAMRSRAFLFFSAVMPLAFLFFYILVFGRGSRAAVPYLLAAVLALSVMGSFWGLSMQLVAFREQGVLRRFRLTPATAGALLGSSIISNYFLMFPTIAAEFLICRFLFHMTEWGDLWSVFVLVSVGTATFSALGLIVASVTNSLQETQVINNSIWFCFLFLSGATIPLPLLPVWIQHFALYLPAAYLVIGLEKAMMWSAGLSAVAEETIALVVSLLAAFEMSRRLFRWEPDEKVPSRAKAWAVVAMVPFLLLGAWETSRGTRLAQSRAIFQSISRGAKPLFGK
jgi:ABC-2 type transport system permease protein